MLTVDQAKQLKRGDILIEIATGAKWRVNGKVKLWKRSPERFEIPVKHGLYRYSYVTEHNANAVRLG